MTQPDEPDEHVPVKKLRDVIWAWEYARDSHLERAKKCEDADDAAGVELNREAARILGACATQAAALIVPREEKMRDDFLTARGLPK